MTDTLDTAIFDVDGTLIDTNYQHTLAWFRAFRRYGIILPLWRLHRAIGMGGDVLVPELTDPEVENRLGDDLRDAEGEEFAKLIDEVTALEGASELLKEVKERGFRVVLASSGQKEDIERYVDLLGVRDVLDGWTTSDDAETSKPAPDLLTAALQSVKGSRAVMIGDSIYDVVAANKLSIPTLTFKTGGFSADELKGAGAAGVFEGPRDLLDQIEKTPLHRAS